MFTGLGTAVRFEKQGLKLRREFSRISNIPGQAWLFTVAVAGLFSCRQGCLNRDIVTSQCFRAFLHFGSVTNDVLSRFER